MEQAGLPIEYALCAAAILAFVFATGLQSIDTEAKLAVFTNKLALAVLIAALIRVHDGWRAVPLGFHPAGKQLPISDAGDAIAALSLYVAPLALLAADFGLRCRSRQHVAMAGLMGAAVPLFGVLLLVGAVGVATGASSFYRPSLTPNVAMTLWSHTAPSAMPGRFMIAGITSFGVLRFGARALVNATAMPAPGTRRGWTLLGFFIVAAGLLSLVPFDPIFGRTSLFSARCLVVTSAVLTGDYLTKSRHPKPTKRIDAAGAFAFLAGMATPLYALLLPAEPTPDLWDLWFPQSYMVALLVCLAGRAAQKLLVRWPTPGSRTRPAPDSSSPNPI